MRHGLEDLKHLFIMQLLVMQSSHNVILVPDVY